MHKSGGFCHTYMLIFYLKGKERARIKGLAFTWHTDSSLFQWNENVKCREECGLWVVFSIFVYLLPHVNYFGGGHSCKMVSNKNFLRRIYSVDT